MLSFRRRNGVLIHLPNGIQRHVTSHQIGRADDVAVLGLTPANEGLFQRVLDSGQHDPGADHGLHRFELTGTFRKGHRGRIGIHIRIEDHVADLRIVEAPVRRCHAVLCAHMGD